MEKRWKNYFLFLISWLKKHLCAEKSVLFFPLFLKLLFLISSFFALKPPKVRQKTSFFVFVQSLFVSLFSFNIFFSFITVVFVHFLLSSFCSSLSAFLPYSFPSFLHSFFFSISAFLFFFFLYLMFPHLFFLHCRFCVSSFCFNSFFCSLCCS